MANHQRLINLAIRFISNLSIQPDLIWCGGAMGWDMAVEQACLELNILYSLALPCYDQENMWSKDWQELYRELLKPAQEIWYARHGAYNGPHCMSQRDYFMVDQCTKGVIALWNTNKRTGGTYKTVQYAQKSRKPVHNAWSDWVKE